MIQSGIHASRIPTSLSLPRPQDLGSVASRGCRYPLTRYPGTDSLKRPLSLHSSYLPVTSATTKRRCGRQKERSTRGRGIRQRPARRRRTIQNSVQSNRLHSMDGRWAKNHPQGPTGFATVCMFIYSAASFAIMSSSYRRLGNTKRAADRVVGPA